MSGELKYACTAARRLQAYYTKLRGEYGASIQRLKQEDLINHAAQIARLEESLKPKGSIDKRWHEDQEALDRARHAGTLRKIDIRLYWKKTYEGHQCKAEAIVTFDDPKYGTDSRKYVSKYTTGGGYDKASTAIDGALERDPSLLRAIVEAGPKAWNEQYGIDERGLPTLSVHGKGVETFRSLFQPYGRPSLKGKWEWTHDDLGKAEVIHITRIR